jgi:tetratricopeptide (TPR) repeat protein
MERRKSDYEPEWAVPAAVILAVVVLSLAAILIRSCNRQESELVKEGVGAGRSGDFRHSEELLDLAVKKCPDCLLPRFNRGVLYFATGRYPEAIAEFDAAVRIDPVDAKSWYARAQALSMGGRKEEAIKSLENAIDLGFDDIPMLNGDEAFVPLHGMEGWPSLWKRWYRKKYGKDPD